MRNGLGKDITAECLQSLVEMFTEDGDLDLKDQDHLKRVEHLKYDHLILRSRSDLEDRDHAHFWLQ